ncbi:uncharacterized protein LOC131631797 [Vicia villosa]|uniref:uncharacterized protein LOC131631797 n=1 Tax=Vicia villosa TaxID=3911 RepID=UPI00273AF41E|nr:uncharacterized protein LOC131631797 [Vicia villosa]
MNNRKIDSFFKRKACEIEREDRDEEIIILTIEEHRGFENPIIEEYHGFENSLERDPGKRTPIWQYPLNQVDAIQRAYLKWGPYQIHLESYPLSGSDDHPRRFQHNWFSIFSSWLEYSPSEDAAYCLPCYLFSKKPSGRPGSHVFISTGFRTWKKVRNGKHCSFLKHIGKDPCSPHNNAMKACQDLLNQDGHIRNVIQVQSLNQRMNNRLCLKTSIDTVRWLTLQACAFRGHDETNNSKNQRNFLELLKLLASYNDEIAKIVLKNAPQNCKVKKHIREEIGDSKFCIVVDEARDESKKEQMALVLRFVDKVGLIQERFFDVAHVKDTTSLTLKEAICDILSRHNLDVSNIRGQGYDGASNMRGEWNGLQALFMKDYPYAYYVHYFAHRLQLALVTSSREVKTINQFFDKLIFVVNVVCSSTKRHDELQTAQLEEISYLLEIDEIVSGKGVNQVGTLKQARDTRWGSHYNSICSLINIYALSSLTKTKSRCSNAMHFVRSTKSFIQDFRENGWDILFTKVRSFCEKHGIEIHDLNDVHSTTRFGCSRLEENQVTIQHYFKVEMFFTTIDKQLQELNDRFSEQAMDLLILSCALSPKDGYKAFNIDIICSLAETYFLIDRLLRLIMTLPISTATTERSFSAMKIIKTKLRNKMDDGFLGDSMTIYIEREISASISSESIIDDFKSLGTRRSLF